MSTSKREITNDKDASPIEKVLSGEVPPSPIAQLLGFRLTSIKPGEAVIEFEATEAHANPVGALHGGVLCDIADAAMGLAYAASLDEDESFTTLELKINFLKPVWSAKLRAMGRIVKRGRTVGMVPATFGQLQIFRSAIECEGRAFFSASLLFSL